MLTLEEKIEQHLEWEEKLPPRELLWWNGIDVELYGEAHDPSCLHSVLQFVKVFELNPALERILHYLVYIKHQAGETVESRVTHIKGKTVPETPKHEERSSYQNRDTLLIPARKCPKCIGWLYVLPIAECEWKVSGRVSANLCDVCTYYTEIFDRDGTLIEIEGE